MQRLEFKRRLEEREKDLRLAAREIKSLKIERDDLRNQRDHYSALFGRLNEHNAVEDSTSGAEISEQSERSRQSRAAPSIGPNHSVHLAEFPSVAGSVHSANVAAQQSVSVNTRISKSVPLKTCHKLLVLLAIALALSTTPSIIYSKHGSDLGGSFTLDTFMLVVVAILGSAFEAYHYPHCDCWR